MKKNIKILLCLFLSLFIIITNLMSKENISSQNTRDKKLFVPVIDEQHALFIVFELDTIVPRVAPWQESIFFQSTPHPTLPGEETWEEANERHKRIWQQRIEKEREKVHINKRFNVLYARGEMYFIRIFYEEITESEFNNQAVGKDIILTDLKHELDYGRFVEFNPAIEPFNAQLLDTNPRFLKGYSRDFLISKNNAEKKRFFKILYFDVLYNYDNSTHNFIWRYNVITAQSNLTPHSSSPPNIQWPEENSIHFTYFYETVMGQVAPLKLTIGWTRRFSGKELIIYNVIRTNIIGCFTEYVYETPNMQYFLASKGQEYSTRRQPFFWDFKNIDLFPVLSAIDSSILPLFRYRYIPGIAYFPDMFSLKSINGKTLEEFAATNCNTHSHPIDSSLLLNIGTYPSLREASPDKYPFPGQYDFPHSNAEFPGGEIALEAYLKSADYPEAAFKSGLTGKVAISFIIDNKGNVLHPTVVMSSTHKILDETALNHIKRMPAWQPALGRGRLSNQTIPTTQTLTIEFNIEQH